MKAKQREPEGALVSEDAPQAPGRIRTCQCQWYPGVVSLAAAAEATARLSGSLRAQLYNHDAIDSSLVTVTVSSQTLRLYHHKPRQPQAERIVCFATVWVSLGNGSRAKQLERARVQVTSRGKLDILLSEATPSIVFKKT
jgi:hypothetical protein